MDCVGSVLTYGCPIWGLTTSKDIERVKLKFWKSSQGVKQTTSNAAVLFVGWCILHHYETVSFVDIIVKEME